jgi:flagellar basal-body rod protein FlgF
MNRGLYTAATGMAATQRMLDVTANNLANVSTNAFKKDGLVFKDALERRMNANGRPIGEMSYGVMAAGEFTDFSAGMLTETGNPLDVAITDNKGAFKVQTPQGPRFTRDGAFRLNDQKELVTRDGYPVLDNQDQPINLDGSSIEISDQGVITVDGNETATLGVFDGTLVKEGRNLYISNDAQASSTIPVRGKAIEGSNVNAIGAMIQMITCQRAFEMSQKAVSQHDELTQRLIQSMNGQ